MVELTESDFNELKAVFGNKSVQKWIRNIKEETKEMDSLSGSNLHSQEGLNIALRKQGVVQGRLQILDEINDLLENNDA